MQKKRCHGKCEQNSACEGSGFLKTKRKYEKDLPRRLYAYFVSYDDTRGAPSFSKFARSLGVTLEELEGYRIHKNFDRAWRECNEIRRDYLIDLALSKRADGSFVKFLMSEGSGEDTGDGSLELTLTVVE